MKRNLILGLVAAFIGLGSSAMAQDTLTWDWSLSIGIWSGSGTFTTATTISTSTDPSSGFSGYLIADITGTWVKEVVGLGSDGSTTDDFFTNSIIALLSPGSLGNDNLLAADGQQLSEDGFAFSSTAGSYSIGYTGSGSLYEVNPEGGTEDRTAGPGFTAALVPVPEPSTLALSVLGGLSGFYFIRRRK